jgi:hypothetical protein
MSASPLVLSLSKESGEAEVFMDKYKSALHKWKALLSYRITNSSTVSDYLVRQLMK